MNHLKKINDTHGHKYGDQAIIKLSKVLKKCSNNYKNSTVFRLGGDEFIILIFDINKTSMDRFKSELESYENIPYQIYDLDTKLSFAMGNYLFYTNSSETIDEAISICDANMYEHKKKTKA